MTTGAEDELLLVRPDGARMETASWQAQAQGDRGPDRGGWPSGPDPLLQVMRNGLLRRSEAAVLRWGEVEVRADGSGRQHVLRSKTDQAAEGSVLYLGPAAVVALLAIRPQEAVIDPGASVFGLLAGQISRRIEAATKMASLEMASVPTRPGSGWPRT